MSMSFDFTCTRCGKEYGTFHPCNEDWERPVCWDCWTPEDQKRLDRKEKKKDRRDGQAKLDRIPRWVRWLNNAVTPKKYLGPGPTGLFLFAALPGDVQAFSSLEEAVQELGGAITFPENLPEVSPRVHAGYNDGLRRSYSPRTDATDGAPRTLTLQEQMEYDKGYIEGLKMKEGFQ